MWSPFLKRNAIQVTIFFAAYYIAGVLGQATTNMRSSNIGPVWPAYGVALAAFLVCGYRVWPAIALGAFVVALSSPVTPLAALGQAAGATLAAFSGAYLLYHILEFDSSLSRLRDALALVLLGALGSSLVSATIGVSVLYGTHVHAYSGPGSAWLIYWLGDTTGVLLVTPLVLTFPTLFRIRDGHRLREFAVLLLLLVATSLAAFGLLPLTPSRVHHMTFAVLPIVMWAAIRFGMSVTALSIFLLTTIATVETALGSGPFTTNTPLMNAVLLDIFFGVVSVTGLSLAAVVAEREHAEGERERLVRERAEVEARLRFAAVVESSDDAIASGTLDGTIASWNKGAEKIYGYTEAEAVGKPINMLVPPELPDEENKILEMLKAGGRIEHFETVRVTKTGKRINVSLTVSPIKDSSGRTVGVSGIARDITERKRAEETLRESEERLRLAVQAGKMYAYEWDVATDVVVRSEESTNILGPTGEPSPLTRQQLLARVHPDDRAKFIAAVDDLKPESPTTHITYRVIRTDGSVIWLEKYGRAFFDPDGRMVRMIGMVADITERKRAEEALRASEERLRLAQQAARIGTFERDIRTGVVTWTPEMESMYGLPTGSFGQTRAAFENLIHPDDRTRLNQLADFALKTGQPATGEWRVVWPDGSVHWIAGRGQVLMDEFGKPLRVVGINMDVTERKRAEEALAGLSRKLIEAQERERIRIGRELHDDINQKIAMLAVELEQLQNDPSDVQNRLQGLRKQMSELSNDVQALSHELHSSKLEYLGVVSGMRSWCREFGERQNMLIDFKGDVSSVVPFEIGISLFRVLQEALQNALKHSGVKSIEVELREGFDEIQLTVTDQGKGFDVEAAIQSRGLGLTSMQERVRLLNGNIEIHSKPMGGTTIHVRVPLESQQASQREAV